jgi:alginate O-acetyltransferase complex protein AlgI
MLFSSIPFLYWFLPVILLFYLAVPKRLKNTVLLMGSLVFYAWGEPRYVLLMAAAILIGYVLGILIGKYRGNVRGKVYTALSVGISLVFLLYFKYTDFFLNSFNAATGLSVPLLSISLPIGISFYTFQMLSYTIDVSRGTTAPQRNLLHLAVYITMFPQLIAGPIVRYTEISEQLDRRSHTLEDTAYGIRRFLLGLGKKVLIANTLGEVCALFLATADPSVLYVWLYAVSFTLQIYYDFSGYSDMAIGLGRLFGFRFPENFDYPYIAGSVTEFWRRWHMTLGGWFRDYLYIPLGGNRLSKARWLLNILVVWMATGLWHGASWNFVVWGLIFAVLLMAEKLFLLPVLKKAKGFAHIYTLLFVTVSFVIFNAADLALAGVHLAAMFGLGGLPLVSAEGLFYLRNYAVVLVLAAVGATPFVKNALAAAQKRTAVQGGLRFLEPVALLAVLLVITACLVNGSFNPFLYFRF